MKRIIRLKEIELKRMIAESVRSVLTESNWDSDIKEVTYEEALEFYRRWGRTILIGSSPNDYYRFNVNDGDSKNLDDCIKQWKRYNDGVPHLYVSERTIDNDMRKMYSVTTGI